MTKKCYCCGEVKPMEMFSKHPGMKDGRINKCKQCHVEYVKRRRSEMSKSDLKAERHAEYEKCILNGSRKRMMSLKEKRESTDPLGRKIVSLRYFHKKRANVKHQTELDDLVFDEAIRLCHKRAELLGGEWWIDHPVPIKGKSVCGLHNAFNMQVVPRKWNESKSNKAICFMFGNSRMES